MADEPAAGPGGAGGGGAGHVAAAANRRVGQYEIVRQIGRGGMAIVYLARQARLDRDVALKELSTFHATSPDMAERFLRESRLAGSLNHPNIVTVLEYFEDGGIPYIAMEYLPRGSLRPYVGRLSFVQFVGVMEGILAGLAQAETFGIVHRDLKPENIMATGDGRVKITDFGIAKATQGAGGAFLTATGTTVGTPSYMAPEQAMGEDIGMWTDLYSVGVMAWEHMVGHVPFHDSQAPMVVLMRQVNEPIPSAHTVDPEVDPDLSAWIDRLLVKDPRERTRSPLVAWDELEEIVIHQVGARWRREARLPSHTAILDTPRPLTPAPFESQKARTPEPLARPPEEAAARPDSGYVTFGREAAPAEPIDIPPVEEPVVEVPPEEEEAVVEVPPEEEAVVEVPPDEEEPIAAPPAPTYHTFGQPPPEVVTPEPAPEEPSIAAMLGPEAVAEVASEPADAEAEPADESETEPEHDEQPELTVAPALVAATIAPEAEPIEEGAPQEPGEPEPPTVAEPARPRRRPLSTTAAALALLGVIAAAAVGFLVAPTGTRTGGGSGLTKTASQGAITVSYPTDWAPGAAPSPAGLRLANELAIRPAAPSRGLLVIGSATTTDPSLLPASLLSALPSTPTAQVVTLGHMQFFRYLDLVPNGAASPETVYALPTTIGTVIGLCELGGAGADVPGDCERALGTLRLSSGRVLGLGPSSTFATGLSRAVSALNAATARAQASLRAATKATQQSTAAQALSAAYSQAASAVGRLQPGPAASPATEALVGALRATGEEYGTLARAAAHDDTRGYGAARAAVTARSGAIAAAFGQLSRLGYVTS